MHLVAKQQTTLPGPLWPETLSVSLFLHFIYLNHQCLVASPLCRRLQVIHLSMLLWVKPLGNTWGNTLSVVLLQIMDNRRDSYLVGGWWRGCTGNTERWGTSGFPHAHHSSWNAVPTVFSCWTLSHPSEHSLTDTSSEKASLISCPSLLNLLFQPNMCFLQKVSWWIEDGCTSFDISPSQRWSLFPSLWIWDDLILINRLRQT